MNNWKWVNHFQPQTLVIATFLCYWNAIFGLLFGLAATSVLAGLIVIVALAAGGFGIANEKKWGYNVGLAMAFLPFILRIAFNGVENIFGGSIINLMFEIALVALLLHPQSRDYQKIWFS